MTCGLRMKEYREEVRVSGGRPYNGVRTGMACLVKSLEDLVHSAVSLYVWSCVQVFKQNI
jgi:hypothetical protein